MRSSAARWRIMMMLRLLNAQGIFGLAVATILIALVSAAKIETRHWKKQSSRFERLYREEATAHAKTEINYRRASDEARMRDAANVARVKRDQRVIDERIQHDFETRLADARARARRLHQAGTSASDPGRGRSAPMPGFPASAGEASHAADQDGLPPADALIATEQAIQLDALIKWVRAQSSINVEPPRN